MKRLLLPMLPTLLAACGHGPPPSDPPPTHGAAEAGDARTGEAARTGPPAAAPPDALDGALTVRDADGWSSAPLRAFLVDRGGVPVAVTARSSVDPTPGDGEPFPLELWEARGVRASARFGALEVPLGVPACAGLDHWSSGVLMLAVEGLPAGLAPAPASRRVPGPGESVDLRPGRAAVAEVFADGFLELVPDDPTALPEPGTPVLDVDGAVVAVVTDRRGTAEAPRVGAQLLLPFLDTPPRLVPQPFDRPLPPLVVGAPSVDGRLLAAATPPLRLIVVDLDRGAPFEPLADLDAGGALDGGEGFGLGIFPDEGFSFAALAPGRSALFEVASGIPLAELEAPRGAPRAVHSRGGRLAVTTDQELLVVDLTDFGVERRVAGSFGPVHVTDAAVLVGALDRVLQVDPSTDAPPAVAVELAPRADGSRPLVTALASDGATLWIGTDRALARAPDDGGRHVARAVLDTGRGAVNVIELDGARVWIGTGSPAEGPDGGLEYADCYVRVLDAGDGRERARSHDHAFPVRAVFADAAGEGRLGISAEGRAFRWRLPER